MQPMQSISPSLQLRGNMNLTFQKALDFTLKWEGGYVNYAGDPGGPTNRGITQKTYDHFRDQIQEPQRPVTEMIEEEMIDIYWLNYWQKANCSNISDPALAVAVFDFAVHSGPRRALRYLAITQIVADYIDKREAFLHRLGQRKPMFLKGWLNRIADLRQYIKEIN